MLRFNGDTIFVQENRGFIEKVDTTEISSDKVHYILYHAVK